MKKTIRSSSIDSQYPCNSLRLYAGLAAALTGARKTNWQNSCSALVNSYAVCTEESVARVNPLDPDFSYTELPEACSIAKRLWCIEYKKSVNGRITAVIRDGHRM